MNDVISFEHIKKILVPYIGRDREKIKSNLGIHSKSKSINNLIVTKILMESMSKYQYLKLNELYNIKTITTHHNDKVKESMSFPKIDYRDVYMNDWLKSKTYKYFTKTFIFICFNRENEIVTFEKIRKWQLSDNELYQLFIVWDKVKTMLINNEIEIGGKYGYSVLNFPSKKEYPFIHIRPHDTDLKKGNSLLPNGKYIANYCFWLSNKYLEKII